jgi:hypothetical protein
LRSDIESVLATTYDRGAYLSWDSWDIIAIISDVCPPLPRTTRVDTRGLTRQTDRSGRMTFRIAPRAAFSAHKTKMSCSIEERSGTL